MNNQKKSATIQEFLGAFKAQIKDLDDQYYQQKQQNKEQLLAASKQNESTTMHIGDSIMQGHCNESSNSSDQYMQL
jgi:Sec-independent protein translocase protein TatA